jgi:hypothetical protein
MTSCKRGRTRGSLLSSCRRSRNSPPIAANASTDEFKVCNLAIKDSKLMDDGPRDCQIFGSATKKKPLERLKREFGSHQTVSGEKPAING